MKKFKMIMCWAFLSIILQCAVLFILSNYYFKTNTDVNIKKIEIEEDTTYKDYHVEIPTNSENQQISYNGQYIAFCENNILKVLDTTTGSYKNLGLDNDFKVSCYKWLSDRNRLVIVGKKNTELILCPIDVDNIDNKKEINISDNISNLSKDIRHNLTIDEISVSSKTGVIYLKALDKKSNCYVYRINTSDQFEIPKLITNKISDIEIIPREDRLVYENLDKTNFYITRPDKKIYFNDGVKYKLIGIDENSNLYVGELDNNTITKVFSKKLDSNSPSIDTINLENPIDSHNIFLNKNGHILLNISSANIVKDITDNKEYKYEGNFVNIYEEGFASLSSDNKLNKYVFKK